MDSTYITGEDHQVCAMKFCGPLFLAYRQVTCGLYPRLTLSGQLFNGAKRAYLRRHHHGHRPHDMVPALCQANAI